MPLVKNSRPRKLYFILPIKRRKMMNIPNYQYSYENGNTVITFEGNYEILDALLQIQESGELEKILGVPVLGIDAYSAMPTAAVPTAKPFLNRLTQWFQGIFNTGWQPVDGLLTRQQLIPAHFATSIQRGKRIDLETDLITHTVNLVVSLTREDEDKAIVNLKVFPTAENPNLPPNLKLIILSEGEVFKEVTSHSADQFIQYEFEAEPGDEFAVKLVLGEAEITEYFVV
jgi:hypothetical protein